MAVIVLLPTRALTGGRLTKLHEAHDDVAEQIAMTVFVKCVKSTVDKF